MAFAYMKDPGWQYLRQSDEQRLKDQSRPYDSKKNVWIPDAEEGFIAGEIKSTKGDDVVVINAKGLEQTLKKDLVQEMNPPKFDKCEDMSNLSFLNDASVLGNLRSRYSDMLIYTYSGLFCVVINPYKRLPIYTETVAQMYMGKRKNEMPPHLFANSDEAYRNMLQDRENQSMLITGESGAGKTENTKKVISYFAAVGASQGGKKDEDPGKKKVTLEDQIVQTNPVLEAFGNAKTVRNNNSSRFGKFIRIHFSNSGKVASCDIEHYLLEKSRVVRQAPGERCYHIFYQMYTSSELRDKLELVKDIADYSSVNQAELTINGVDDVEEFALTDEAFDILNFSPTEKLECYKLMSGIMHMYDMKFKQKPREEQAEADGVEDAKHAASMMGVDHEKLINSLLKPRVKVGKEWVNKGQNLEQVRWAIGAMSRGVYDRVFNWLVKMCNKTLDQKELERKYFIGVLDIAGFEIFDFNSFEQLWINFVNEKLQQFFNHHMFVLEQEEYKKEGIQWTFIDFGLDLAACIELIEKPMGIIAMLDEECIVPKATDMTLAQKLTDQHLGKHPNFQKPKPPKGKQAEAHFAMAHYAGIVRYNVTNWLEKNKDPLNDTCVSVMKNGSNALLLTIWSDYTTQEEAAKAEAAGGGGGGRKKGKSASMMTVSNKYREGLNSLMTMLNMTHPHFVRCLIPNELKKSGVLDAALVMNQLTCNGVLEGIRICRKGFPNRMLHPDFRQRYSVLGADEAKSSEDPKVCSEAILGKVVKEGRLEQDNFRVGLTKIFFKAGILAHMEDLRDETLSAIMQGLQSKIRWHLELLNCKKRKEQALGRTIIQGNIRAWLELRNWPWYQLLGKSKGLAGTVKEKEELDRLTKEHDEMDNKLKAEEDARKAIEEKMGNLDASIKELDDELQKRRALEGDSESKIADLAVKKADLEKSLSDLQSRQSREEDRGGELRRQKARLEGDREDARKAIREMESTLKRTEADRNNKGIALQTLEGERALQEEALARLTKEHQHQSELNEKLRKDCLAAQENMNELAKEKSNSQRRVDDMESNLDRERRDRFDVERENQQLESKLRTAMNKIEQLTQQFLEMEHRTKMKEQELMSSYARVKDEALQAQRLEQQVMDVSNTLQGMGRRLAVSQRY